MVCHENAPQRGAFLMRPETNRLMAVLFPALLGAGIRPVDHAFAAIGEHLKKAVRVIAGLPPTQRAAHFTLQCLACSSGTVGVSGPGCGLAVKPEAGQSVGGMFDEQDRQSLAPVDRRSPPLLFAGALKRDAGLQRRGKPLRDTPGIIAGKVNLDVWIVLHGIIAAAGQGWIQGPDSSDQGPWQGCVHRADEWWRCVDRTRWFVAPVSQ